MNKPLFAWRCVLPLALLLGPCCGRSAENHLQDYPTLERVQYVQSCMREHPGPEYEMQSKCACALDHLASDLRFDSYIELSTEAKAISIGGERGGVMRDNEAVKEAVQQFRKLQSRAEKACFLAPAKR